eukprot:COSAG03_NODE_25195_length_267_cov_0.619048_1_plen_66_part_10
MQHAVLQASVPSGNMIVVKHIRIACSRLVSKKQTQATRVSATVGPSDKYKRGREIASRGIWRPSSA